ncbi:MAG TPA: hypothetical protein PJ990_02820 [Saprospiraceae bacterium]|nr:hypothetical protein [Saprospiraceae bacterium]
MKTKVFSTLVILLMFVAISQAQDYKTAVGGKVGFALVASYKAFLNESAAVDVFGGIHWGGGLMAGVNYSIHKDIPAVDRLKWYYGAGANFFSYGGAFGFKNWFEFGVSGNIGLDYSFEEMPLNVSLDYVPTIVILENDDFDRFNRLRTGYGALTVRYILN